MENKKETSMDVGLVEEIAKALNVETKSVSLESYDWWEQGRRASTHRILVPGSKDKHYVLKIFDKDCEKDFLEEKAILRVANRYCEGLCPTIKAEIDDYRSFLLEVIADPTLEEKLKDKESVDWREVEQAVGPVVRMHKELSKNKDRIIEELRNISKNKYTEIDLLDAKKYHKEFVKALEALGLPHRKLAQTFFSLIENYLTGHNGDSPFTIIQHDGYPWHNTLSSIIDMGSVKEGSYLQHLGCLFGYPSVFSKLKNPEEAVRNLCVMYLKASGKESDLEKSEKGFYVGSVYSNFRIASLAKTMDRAMKDTLRVQLRILKEIWDEAELKTLDGYLK